MKQQFIPRDKRSKREQKAANDRQRNTWGEFKPVTKVKENAKAYNRKKSKHIAWHDHGGCLDFLVGA